MPITLIQSSMSIGASLDIINANFSLLESIAGSGGGGPHTHPWSDITDKPSVFPPSTHSHAWDDITGKPSLFQPAEHSHTWGQITGKPTEFAPESHNHTWSDIQNPPPSYPPSTHGHPWSEVTDKPSTFAPAAHDHAWSEITGKPSQFPAEAHSHDWTEITGKPSTFTPSTHSHAWVDITGKPTEFQPVTHQHDWSEVNNRPPVFPPEAHGHEIADVAGLSSALASKEPSLPSKSGNELKFLRVAAGGTALEWVSSSGGSVDWADITNKPSTFTPSSHGHVIGDITNLSNELAAREPLLPSKAGNALKVLRVNSAADGLEWATVSGGGGSNWSMYAASSVSVASSAAEFTAASITIPAGTLAENGQAVSIACAGSFLNNTGSNQSLTVRIKVGGTTVYDELPSGSVTSNASARFQLISFTIVRVSATTAVLYGTYSLSSAAAATTGYGDLSAAPFRMAQFSSVIGLSLDTSQDATVVIALQFGASNANLSYTGLYEHAIKL